MAEPETANLLNQIAAAFGVFATTLAGKSGFDARRRRRNGFAPPPGCPASAGGVAKIVAAIEREGDATRKVHYETTEKTSDKLGAMAKELGIIKDRLPRGGP